MRWRAFCWRHAAARWPSQRRRGRPRTVACWLALGLVERTAAGSLTAKTRLYGGVYGRPLLNPQVAITASGSYVAWQVSPLGSSVRSELARFDPASGRIEATRRLGGAFQQAIAAGGPLWVAISTGDGEEVLRLSPATLRVTGMWHVGSGGGQPYGAEVIAVAGAGSGPLAVTGWCAVPVGGPRPDFDRPARRRLPRTCQPDAAGTVLIIGVADSGGSGAVERRDPVTGALLGSHACRT